MAGGEGSRLRELTRIIEGDERPKQFCHIIEGQSLLDMTRRRTSLIIDPDRIHFSLTAGHERYFRPILFDVPEPRLHVQPLNKGTAPAILFSLLRLAELSRMSTAVFFPSDHYFSDLAKLKENVDRAFRIVETGSAGLVLLGIEPTYAETAYGWIEPSDSLFGSLTHSVSRVRRFWEKPDRSTANELLNRGGLWNSFVMVARVTDLLDRFKSCLPDLYSELSVTVGHAEEEVMNAVYDRIPESNFSAEVLERSTDMLHVLRVNDVNWSDLGEPQRLLGTMNVLGEKAEWMAYAA